MNTQLSFDGFGINDTDDYRTRLATFAQSVPDDRRKELARLWIAAPELVSTLKEIAVVEGPVSIRRGVLHFEDGTDIDLRKLIDTVEGKDTPS